MHGGVLFQRYIVDAQILRAYGPHTMVWVLL